jgi:sensor histidine kinase YesM
MMNSTLRNLIICICAIALIIVTLLYSPQLIKTEQYNVKPVTEWTTSEGAQKTPLFLNRDSEGFSKISTILPENYVNGSYLCFWSYFSSVNVYVDGQKIYCHDNLDGNSFGEAAYSKWNHVKLPEASQGKELLIVFYSPYKDIDLRLNKAIIGDINEIHKYLHSNFALSRFIEIALIWMGLLFITLGFWQNNVRFKRHPIYAGIFILMFGLYMCTAQKTMPLDIIPAFTRGFICYFCMFGMSIPLTLYVREKVKNYIAKVKLCNLLIILECLVMASAFVLHAFAILDIHYMLIYAMILLLGAIISAIVFSIDMCIRRRNVVSFFTAVVPGIMLVVMLLEYSQFYYSGNYYFETGTVCRLGAVIVVVIETVLYFHRLKIEKQKIAKMNEENVNLKLQILTDNIQPHFILNTIGAIRALIDDEPKRASDLLLDFSKYIRKKLEHTDYTKPIPFTEELEHIKIYLKLEETRYGDNIEVVWNIHDSAFRVLPLTVQPFVENAIKHGLFSMENGGKLTISSYKGMHCHIIEITDNGIGFDANDINSVIENKKSVGLKSAIMRLENKMNATVTIRSHAGGNGTRVRIDIPTVR